MEDDDCEMLTERPEPRINTSCYMASAFLATVCCCIPFGVVAIIKASNLKSAVDKNDMETAQKERKSAQSWILASVVSGTVCVIVYIICTIFRYKDD